MADYTVQNVRLVLEVHNQLIAKKKMTKGPLISLERHMAPNELALFILQTV